MKVITKALCIPKSPSTQSPDFQHNLINLSCIILTITNESSLVTSVVSPSKIYRKRLKTTSSSQPTVKLRTVLEMTCSQRSWVRANSKCLNRVRTRTAPSHLLKARS